MDILSAMQFELIANKSQRNNFGNYNYRSCEDILQGLKTLIDKYKVSVVLSDEIKVVSDRVYVVATATLLQGGNTLGQATAFAREPLSQKGMNEAQITGSASSYARKYALNGLFAIDDSKDADTNEHQNNANNRPAPRKVTKVEKVAPVDFRHEIFNLMESGKVPAADKETYITRFKADASLLNAKTVAELKAKYFNA